MSAPKSYRPKKGKHLLAENDAVKYQEHLLDFDNFDKKTPINFKKSYIDIINEKEYNFDKSLFRAIKKGKDGTFSTLCQFIGNDDQQTGQESQMAKKFFHEIDTYIRLRQHAGLCTFVGYYLIPQKTIVGGYFEHGSLSDIYKKLKSKKSLSGSGRFQWSSLMKAKIIFGTACAMLHLHANKIFHTNLQPSQIYFDKNYEPQLTGYASFYPKHIPESFDDYEDDDEFREAFPYIPPEILNHNFDPKLLRKADVFSYGVLIYTVVMDGEESLFEMLEDEDFYEKYKSGELRPEFPEDINPLLKGIITKSWDPDPSKRPLFSQIIKALQNNKEIFSDLSVDQYEIYQETLFEDIDIPQEDIKLLKTPKAPEPPKESENIRKPKPKMERKTSSTTIPKPKPIEELTNSELGGTADFGNILKNAQAGKKDAIVSVGYALHKGNGCKKNDNLAFQFYKKAAELESQIGMYNCAMLMSTGYGTEKNEKKAMEMMKEATGIEDINDDEEERDKWYSKAIITYGQMLESKGEDDEAEKYFLAAISLGKDSNGDSYYTYAKFLEKHGKTKKALENYLKAAERGHKMAANDYAITLLSTSDGKPPSQENVDEAIKNLKKACQQNQPVASANYGNILYFGKYGVRKNKEKAVELFKQAAEKDHPEGCFMYGYALSHEDSGVDEDLDEAKIYFKKAADQGHAIAMVQLARILQEEDNDEEAVQYLKRGAEIKDPVAMFRYGECLEKGKGVKKDMDKAKKLYQDAASKGNQQAKKKLKSLEDEDDDDDEASDAAKDSDDEEDSDKIKAKSKSKVKPKDKAKVKAKDDDDDDDDDEGSDKIKAKSKSKVKPKDKAKVKAKDDDDEEEDKDEDSDKIKSKVKAKVKAKDDDEDSDKDEGDGDEGDEDGDKDEGDEDEDDE